MPARIPAEKIIKIRKEIRQGKTRRQLAREMDICLDTICKYSKHITFKKIGKEFKEIIREEVSSGKTKRQVAKEFGIGYYTVRKITSDINHNTLTKDQIKLIRKKVKSGKTKKRVAQETNVSYYNVRKVTKDINNDRLPSQIRLKIKYFYEKGYTTQKIAEQLNISEFTVKNYTVLGQDDYPTYRQVPKEIIEEIRKRVKKGQSKMQVSHDLNISYKKVRRFTKDLEVNKHDRKRNEEQKKLIKKIRKEVSSGKTKKQVARELNLKPSKVYYHTLDIVTGHLHDREVTGRNYELLQKIMKNGYAFPSQKHSYKHFKQLRLKFPNICRVKMYNRVIYFHEEKADLACKEFLKNLHIKITNYHELKQVLDVFKTKLKKEEKKQYIK